LTGGDDAAIVAFFVGEFLDLWGGSGIGGGFPGRERLCIAGR